VTAPAPGSGTGATAEASTHRYSVGELRDFAARVFRSAGLPEGHADTAAEVLTAADLRGIDTHGVARLHQYYEMLVQGRVNPRADVRILRETPSTARMDGDNGLGLVVGPAANELAIEKAAAAGSGWVSVGNSNHFGIAGIYSLRALERDCIGWVMTSSPPQVAPFQGVGRMLGTNPIAIAFPGRAEPPMVMDFTTSAISFGRLEDAIRTGGALPEGTAIDREGRMTTDPHAVKDGGALVPLGSDAARGAHKGYCLAAMVDVLSCVLSGANWGPFAPPFPADLPDSGRRVGKGLGHLFGVLPIASFREPDEFKEAMDHWMREFRGAPAAPGTGGPEIPGHREHHSSVRRRREGIPLSGTVVEGLRHLGVRAGVLFD
jgi:L-2-hydroxycarboxylate dehydrogenase (NAD+)